MHMDLQKINLLGRLVTDPRGRGNATVFRMGINPREEQATYYTVVTLGPLAQVAARYLRRGDRLYVEGRLRRGTLKTRAGRKIRATWVIAQSMIMLGSAPRQEAVRKQQVQG